MYRNSFLENKANHLENRTSYFLMVRLILYQQEMLQLFLCDYFTSFVWGDSIFFFIMTIK